MPRWKSARERGAAEVPSSKFSSLTWSKWDLKCRLNINRRAVLHSRLKLPLREGFTRVSIQAIIDSSQHSNIPDRAIRPDDRIEDHRSVNVFVHQLERVCRVYLACGHRLRNIFGGRRSACGFVIAFSETDNPASSGRVQVGHVQSNRIELAVSEDGALNRGEIGNTLCRHRTR